MNRIYMGLLLCAAIFWSVSCSDTNFKSEKIAMDYFSGEFVYFADAARFYDCATGVSYPVSQSRGYLSAERHYMSMNPTQGERISIEFRGHIEQLPPMEGDDMVHTMIIDTLIGFDRTVMCNPNGQLSGLYESSDSTRKETLRLRSDYTFTRIHFLNYPNEVVTEGVWGLASALELVLKPLSVTPTSSGLSASSSDKNPEINTLLPYDKTSVDKETVPITASDVPTPNGVKAKEKTEELKMEMFQIIPDRHVLAANGDDGISGFKKIYVN